MTVTFTDLLPTNVTQAQNNVPVAKLNVKASNNTVIWQGLTVQRTGQNPDDADVVHVNLWKDINDNGIFDDGNPVPVSPLAARHRSRAIRPCRSPSPRPYPSGPGVLFIDSELIKFASNDGVNTFTGLTRGFLGTTADVARARPQRLRRRQRYARGRQPRQTGPGHQRHQQLLAIPSPP